MGVVRVALLDGEPDGRGQRHVQLVLVVAHRQLIVLRHPAQHIHHLSSIRTVRQGQGKGISA